MPAAMPPLKRKRAAHPAAHAPEANEDDATQRPRKRGRPRADQVAKRSPKPNAKTSKPARRRSGRLSNAGGEVDAPPSSGERASQVVDGREPPRTAEAEASTTVEEPSTRKRKRVAKPAQQEVDEPSASALPKRRGRPSLQDQRSDAQDRSKLEQPKRMTRQKQSPRRSAPSSPPRRRRRITASRRSATTGTPSSHSNTAIHSPPADASPSPSPLRNFIHAAPHPVRIKQAIIDKTWSPLPPSSHANLSSLLQLAQQPILQRLAGGTERSDRRRRLHTVSALRLATSRILRKVERGLPFPPARLADSSGREADLDFERVLRAEADLAARLDAAKHAVRLLRKEKEKVEAELEDDYETLRELEKTARTQAREQRAVLKRAHVLAPGEARASGAGDAPTPQFIFPRRDAAAAAPSLDNPFSFADGRDDEDPLRPLMSQLSDHVGSLRANLEQVDGIVPQLARSRAALQAVLLRHLSQDQYEQVVCPELGRTESLTRDNEK